MEFKIIEHSDSKEFETEINDLLSIGWELRGDTQITFWKGAFRSEDRFIYTQTMVKHERD